MTSKDNKPDSPPATGGKRRFGPDTVVAEAIAADPAVVDRLIALNPTFSKLRNPVLRKVMARLVNFADAAKVAGVPLAAILAAVNDEPPPAHAAAAETASAPAAPPAWLAGVDPAKAHRLDVRPLLARGEEPLGVIMRQAGPLAVGETLILDAPFDPAPLRRVLAGKGFVDHAEQMASDHWRITFHRTGKGAPAAASEGGAKIWREADGAHIDVRGLQPPQPMLAILQLLEAPDTGATVIVHHEREPMFLYPELATRGWRHELVASEPDEVRLRLQRGAE